MKKYPFLSKLAAIIIFASVAFTSCDSGLFDDLTLDDVIGDSRFGWFGSTENIDEMEHDIYLGGAAANSSLVDLSPKFPPMGNQGMYGTCVAWACAYNLRTYIGAQENKLSKTQLASTSNQYSPKDMFWAIASNKKGADCNGTSFEAAFDIMISRGVATMATVPYTDLGDCSGSPQSAWTSNANQNKIDHYRKINVDRNTIKGYLAQGRPVVFGAKLGDNFMKWSSADVMTSDNDTYNGQHAYHAMILSGYNDNKGPNGAFRVVNSWGTNWADEGHIWIDYSFFETFCFAAFVAKGLVDNPDSNNDNHVDPNQLVANVDLIGWELNDFQDPNSTDPRKRSITYNVYNMGQESLPASADWNIIYLYYNAYDANDFGILLYDYYSNDYGAYGEDGSLSSISGAHAPGISGNWWNHINVPGGVSVAHALYGEADSRFSWGYNMPATVSGKYYLVLIADGYDVIKEENEANNYYYFTNNAGGPLTITNGVIDASKARLVNLPQKPKKPTPGSILPYSTVRNEQNVNTYTPAEIMQLIKYHRETGNLQRKVENFLKTNNTKKQWQ